jgi:uncharacterized membrane protein YgaE (UPF0421/DUF939 family)
VRPACSHIVAAQLAAEKEALEVADELYLKKTRLAEAEKERREAAERLLRSACDSLSIDDIEDYFAKYEEAARVTELEEK